MVLAESDQTVVVEGNHYFPADSVRRQEQPRCRLVLPRAEARGRAGHKPHA